MTNSDNRGPGQAMSEYTEIPVEQATSAVGSTIHKMLRTTVQAKGSADLWAAIDTHMEAWSDAVECALWRLQSEGYVVCEKQQEERTP